MAFAPFRDFLALVILDGDFDLPQHQLAGLAGGRSKEGGGAAGRRGKSRPPPPPQQGTAMW